MSVFLCLGKNLGHGDHDISKKEFITVQIKIGLILFHNGIIRRCLKGDHRK